MHETLDLSIEILYKFSSSRYCPKQMCKYLMVWFCRQPYGSDLLCGRSIYLYTLSWIIHLTNSYSNNVTSRKCGVFLHCALLNLQPTQCYITSYRTINHMVIIQKEMKIGLLISWYSGLNMIRTRTCNRNCWKLWLNILCFFFFFLLIFQILNWIDYSVH